MWGGNSGTNGYGGMGSMMGQTGTTVQAAANPLLPYFGVLFAVLIGVTIVGVIGVAYYLCLSADPNGRCSTCSASSS